MRPDRIAKKFSKAALITTFLESETEFRPSYISVSFRGGALSNNNTRHYELMNLAAEGTSSIRKINNVEEAKEEDVYAQVS
jgi:hypothetical protein